MKKAIKTVCVAGGALFGLYNFLCRYGRGNWLWLDI